MIIDMFVNSGYELSNIHTVGEMDEALHLGVMRYVAAYDNDEWTILPLLNVAKNITGKHSTEE